jgi:hypothetical protein
MRALVVLALLAVGAVTPLACGGGSTELESLAPPEAVAQAATKTAKADTYRASFTGSLGVAGQTLRMTGDGEFDAEGKRGHMTMAYTVAGQKLVTEMVLELPVMYMRLPAELGAQLPSGKRWISIDLDEVGQELGFEFQQLMQASQSDPSQSLQYLRGAAGLRTVGQEEVRGVETTHYRGTVEFRRLAEQFPEMKESIDRLIELTKVEQVPTDVWVDDDDLVRRMGFAYNDMQFAPGQRGDMSMTIELFDFGTDVDVETPPADQVIDLQELLGQGD